MLQLAIFSTFLVFGISASGLILRWYALPRLSQCSLADGLRALAMFHAFRYVGLGFLAGPDVVGPIGRSLALHLALGDLLTAILALAAALALARSGATRPAIALSWAFNLVGFTDLVTGIARSIVLMAGGEGMAGAGPWPYVIVGFYVPALLATHVVMFSILLGRRPAATEA